MIIKSSKAFTVLVIILLCCILLFFFALLYLKINLFFAISCALILTFWVIRYWISVGRILLMDEEGCTIKFWQFSRHYKWSELQIKQIENHDNSLGYRIPYLRGATFSSKPIKKPTWIKPTVYSMIRHPFEFFYVNFALNIKYRKFDYKCPDIYVVKEEEFMENMRKWNVEFISDS